MKNVVKNVSVHVSWHIYECIMLGIPKSGTAGSQSLSAFSFVSNVKQFTNVIVPLHTPTRSILEFLLPHVFANICDSVLF